MLHWFLLFCTGLGVLIVSAVCLYFLIFSLVSLHFTIAEMIAELRIHLKFGGSIKDFRWWLLPYIIARETIEKFGSFYGDSVVITYYEENKGRATYHVPTHLFSFGEINYTIFKESEK